VLIILVAVSAARAAGADAQALATTGGLVTAGLTFSLQQTLGDLVAGILLSARAPFEVGDWIAYDDDRMHTGRVVEINWRDTRLHTNEDVEIVVPNSLLSRASIMVFTKPRRISRRQVFFDVGYQHAPHDVIEVVREAISDPLFGVMQTPSPDVVLSSFEASAVRYTVRFFIEDFARREPIDSEMRMRLWYALHRGGIDFQFPRLDVEMLSKTMHDPESRMLRRAEALSRVDFLQKMAHEDVVALAKASKTRIFHQGEVVVRAGDTSTELYVVASGECVVRTDTGREVARLGAGDFFGEMALLTGEPRSATVAAVTPCTLHVLDAQTFRTVIARYPDKLEQVSKVVADRQAEIERRRGADISVELKAKQQETLLTRMRRFFSGGSSDE
jgi:CRP-like cAMP-binding protein